ncbi:MAG: hypothetical protein H7Y14_08200 [Burkholderiales bacterium]|nr:hypothetical protein [Burkholderiales bacterium]
MDRRGLLALGIAGLLVGISAFAQKADRPYRVAYLAGSLISPSEPATPGGYFDAVTRQLGSHGIVAGRNLETRFFYRRNDLRDQRDNEWKKEVIAEALSWQPDAIVVVGAEVVRVLKGFRTNVPVVFGLVQDPVSEGLVMNLGRPEANITGAGIDYYSLAIKRLELAREMVPSLKRVLIVHDRRGGPLPAGPMREFRRVARGMNVEVSDVDITEIDGGLCSAGAHARNATADVILPMGNIGPPLDDRGGKSWVEGYGDCLYEMQKRSGIPVIDDSSDTVGQGVVAAIGEESFESFRRAANVLARILKGAKPADVPVDMQMRVQIVLNAKSAREIRLELPAVLRLRADRVIE